MTHHPDSLWIDFETRSRVDLKASGARRYARDPSTGITVVVWHFRGVRKSACPIHPPLGTHSLFDLYLDIPQAARIVAHHANFDVSILHATFPALRLQPSVIDCTMGRAQAIALPGGLDNLCKALGIRGKDPRGHQLVMLTCKPRKDGTFNEDFDTYRELMEYCDRDVDCLIDVDNRLPPLSPAERLVFERTWRKNDAGLPIDVQLASAIAIRRQEIEQQSMAALMELTGGAVTKITQRARILQWANSDNRAAGLASTQKHVIAEALQNEDLHPDVRAVLEILQADGGSAPTKAQALLDRHVEGFYKDGTRYFGARSGRGTSEGANLFNIARPSGKYNGKNGKPTIEDVITGLKLGMKYDNTALTDCLRGCIVAPSGMLLIDNDLANAELRFALWQAGDTERLGILARNGDLYMYNGIKLFNLPQDATKDTHPKERQTAKNVTLGGNYQLGPKTYLAFLIRTAAENGLKRHELTMDKATSDIYGYRDANPLLVDLWDVLKEAFKMCIYDAPYRTFPAGKIAFEKDAHGTIWMHLPSGRSVPHYNAHITHDGNMAFYRAKFGTMLRQKVFGGSLLEISCFAGDTEVLTRTGFKRIDAVTASDQVWDGVEWVRQKGPVCRGVKTVTEVCGTRVTPDHLILCSEVGSTQTWRGAGGLSPNELRSAIGLATSSLPDGFRDQKAVASGWTFLSNVTAVLRKKSSAAVIFATRVSSAVRYALGSHLLAFGKREAGATSFPMTGFGSSYCPPSPAPSPGVRTQSTSISRATGGAASKYMIDGSRIGALFLSTLSRCTGTTISALNWTASTMTATTNPATFVSRLAKAKHSIADECKISKPSELVYDLLDCGPRNRFMIRTRTGRYLLAHNCQCMTRDLVTAAEADIENEMPDTRLMLDVYDSILALAPAEVAEQRSEQMRQIMTRPRAWTAGLPIGAEGYVHTRMKK